MSLNNMQSSEGIIVDSVIHSAHRELNDEQSIY